MEEFIVSRLFRSGALNPRFGDFLVHFTEQLEPKFIRKLDLLELSKIIPQITP